MLCSTPGETSHVTAALHDHGAHADHAGHTIHADHADHAGHTIHDGGGDHATPGHAGSHGDGNRGHADSCNLCVSGCHATPLATAPPEVLAPLLTAKVRFPPLSAAAPAFQSDGQERPPRSI
jgi:hypothetical protein